MQCSIYPGDSRQLAALAASMGDVIRDDDVIRDTSSEDASHDRDDIEDDDDEDLRVSGQ